ncbi:hypothetical protein C5C34_12935 [Rathayibacter rathayi]|nr:hypothetical protein C5C34_12935 [Rathayibacter rathayi]PPG92407.1 hypothetical protein C5C22_12790 [Rathayibacter rathayi]
MAGDGRWECRRDRGAAPRCAGRVRQRDRAADPILRWAAAAAAAAGAVGGGARGGDHRGAADGRGSGAA